MKAKQWFVIALVIILALVPLTVLAQAEIKHCSGTETMIGLIDHGVWTYPDGNIHVRGMKSQYADNTNCPEVSGIVTTIMNANWDSKGVGPMWGTARSETTYNGGGVWEGTWTGKTYPDGTYSYTGITKGVSGSVLGLRNRVSAHTDEPNGPTFVKIDIIVTSAYQQNNP